MGTDIPSILDSIKTSLGVPLDYPVFDAEITMHINSVFGTLNQLGVGPVEGFRIDDNTKTWATYLPDDLKLNDVKDYVFLRVKMVFDPPSNPNLVTAYKETIKEAEWRLNVKVDDGPSMEPESVLDGGQP